MEVTQGNIQTLHIGFNALLSRTMTTAKANWRVFASKAASSTKRNEYSWMRKIPQLERSFGPLVIDNLVRKGYQVENFPFKVGWGVSVDDIEDDNLGGIDLGVQAIMTDAVGFIDRAVHTLLPLGLPSGKGLAFDDLTFFNAAHTKLDGTTYSNVDAGGGGNWWYLLDTRMGVMPLLWQERKPLQMSVQNMPQDDCVFEDDEVRWKMRARYGFGYTFPQLAYASNQTLNETNLEAATVAMMEQVGDDGRKIGIMPTVLVVGPSNKFAAERLLEAQYNAAGATNIHYQKLDLAVSHYVETVVVPNLID